MRAMMRARSLTGRGYTRVRSALLCAAATLLISATTAMAQAPKIWDVVFGTPVAALPLDQFGDTACGTNGGPPARVLKSFAEFAQCAVERTTGLHEVWFRYDDEMEYVARARRSEIMVRQYQANSLAGQPIITSLLIDDAGLVQGYRVVNHPRVDSQTRSNAYGLVPQPRRNPCRRPDLLKVMACSGLEANDLPPAAGERPLDALFVKDLGENKPGGLVTRVDPRRYNTPGLFAAVPNNNRLT